MQHYENDVIVDTEYTDLCLHRRYIHNTSVCFWLNEFACTIKFNVVFCLQNGWSCKFIFDWQMFIFTIMIIWGDNLEMSANFKSWFPGHENFIWSTDMKCHFIIKKTVNSTGGNWNELLKSCISTRTYTCEHLPKCKQFIPETNRFWFHIRFFSLPHFWLTCLKILKYFHSI